MMLLGATAYDLAPSPDGPGWVRIEELSQEEHPGAMSHDVSVFQAYGGDGVDNDCDGAVDEGCP